MRRRIWLLVLAAVLMVAGAVTYFMARPDTRPAPATQESLAAVAVDVLDIEPSSYDPDRRDPYGVLVNWHPDDSGESHYLVLDIKDREDARRGPCRSNCATWRVAEDEIRLDWDNEHVESDPGFLMVSLEKGGEVRSLVYGGAIINGDPRNNTELPIPVSKLTDVILDERFASTTTREMTSVELDKWPEG